MVDVIGENRVDVWHENVVTIEVFIAMQTQWNMGPSGAIGLRYESIPFVMDQHSIPAADRPALFAGVATMERAALEEFRRG